MKEEFSAGAIIYKKDKGIKLLFLITHENTLDIPKGHIEKGEDCESAAKREIKEETNLDVNFLPYFKYKNEYFILKNGRRILKKVTVFLARVEKKAKVRISSEHAGYAWLSYDEALKKEKYKDMKILLKSAIEYIVRYEKMEKLNKEYGQVSLANALNLSNRLVPGEGPLNAKIMLVGQAPGNTEDKLLKPFVGRSGKLLDMILNKAQINRKEIYITSVVQFFPPNNRVPSKKEIELCRPFLLRQISIIKPKIIILLGNVATNALLDIGEVNKNHSRFIKRGNVNFFITYHPAAALRFKRIKNTMEKDLKKLTKVIN
ncbi:MAG: uracil-DNA glycosylase family protein [Candidatus Micrarchaeia archaeon]